MFIVKKISAYIYYVFFLLNITSLYSCNQKKSENNAGEVAAEQKEEIDMEQNIEDDFEQGSTPVAISGTNLTYENTKVVCHYKLQDKNNAKIKCQAVDSSFSGTTILPASKDETLELKWNTPITKSGQIDKFECYEDIVAFSYECSVERSASIEPAAIEFSLELKDSLKDKTRKEKEIVTLEVSIQFTAGYIPSLPFEYIPEAKKVELSVATLGLAGNSVAQKEVLGLAQSFRPLLSLSFPPGSISSICISDRKLYLAAGSSIYLIQGDRYLTYAGIGRIGAEETFEDRYRVHFGGSLKIACDKDGVYVADNMKYRILKLFDSGPVIKIAGKDSEPKFGFSVDGTEAVKSKLLPVSAMAVHPQNGLLYFAQTLNNSIRYIDTKGHIQTLIGRADKVSEESIQDIFSTPDLAAELKAFTPFGVDLIPKSVNQKLLLSDISFNAKNGTWYESCHFGIARNGLGVISGFCPDKRDSSVDFTNSLGRISGFSFDADGNLYIANEQSHVLQKVNATSLSVELLAGTPFERGHSPNGSNTSQSKVARASHIVVGPNGQIFFSSNTALRYIDSESKLQTLAGNLDDVVLVLGRKSGVATVLQQYEDGIYLNDFRDTPFSGARFSMLQDFDLDAEGNIYIHDTNQLMRLDVKSQTITTMHKKYQKPKEITKCGEPQDIHTTVLGNISRIRYHHENKIYFLSNTQLFLLDRKAATDTFKLIRLSHCGNENLEGASEVYSIIDFGIDASGEVYLYIHFDKLNVPVNINNFTLEGYFPSIYKISDGKTIESATKILDQALSGYKIGEVESFFDQDRLDSTMYSLAMGGSPVLKDGKLYSLHQFQQAPFVLQGFVLFNGYQVGEYDLSSGKKRILDYLDFFDTSKAIKYSRTENQLLEIAFNATTSFPDDLAYFDNGLLVTLPNQHKVIHVKLEPKLTPSYGRGHQ